MAATPPVTGTSSGILPRAPAGGERPGWSRYGRDLAAVLVVKAIVLALIWFAFFRAPVAPHMAMPPAAVAERLVGAAAPAEVPHAAP